MAALFCSAVRAAARAFASDRWLPAPAKPPLTAEATPPMILETDMVDEETKLPS